jgi:hypothetical protein
VAPTASKRDSNDTEPIQKPAMQMFQLNKPRAN